MQNLTAKGDFRFLAGETISSLIHLSISPSIHSRNVQISTTTIGLTCYLSEKNSFLCDNNSVNYLSFTVVVESTTSDVKIHVKH